ncbi:hypothetical protein QYM36_011711 [Artemia franciscana]|uniref:Reverse transcriptase domain-containing protein n=1 Tax=Artemia franciscana TaxID=6661 RepID=A0AA88HQ38_ARTSF|nr:hypothetical protein QYM36_011711 [Artemia franciscana]
MGKVAEEEDDGMNDDNMQGDLDMNRKKFWQLVRGSINPSTTEQIVGTDTWPKYLESLDNSKDGALEDLSQTLSQQVCYPLREVDYKLISPFIHEEIGKALESMERGYAPGAFLKWGKTNFSAILVSLFSALVSSCKWPEESGLSVTILLFKKGDRSHHNNYKGIHLGNSLPNLFCKVIDFGLWRWIENRDVLDKGQTGFREDLGTTDDIFSLQALINTYASAKKERLYKAFIDIKGTYDNVCRFLLMVKFV